MKRMMNDEWRSESAPDKGHEKVGLIVGIGR
jgi:hypothetical protein